MDKYVKQSRHTVSFVRVKRITLVLYVNDVSRKSVEIKISFSLSLFLSVNPCLRNPCSSGQRCVINSQQIATCVCNIPYCQRRKENEFYVYACVYVCYWYTYVWSVCLGDICIPNPCLNGGACITQSLGFTCQCRPGFLGLTCQICKHVFSLTLNSYFSSDRWCMCSESMSKWRFMRIWWTHRIISLLLSSCIHRTFLWYS